MVVGGTAAPGPTHLAWVVRKRHGTGHGGRPWQKRDERSPLRALSAQLPAAFTQPLRPPRGSRHARLRLVDEI